MGFPASSAHYRCPRGAEIGRPSDFAKSGRPTTRACRDAPSRRGPARPRRPRGGRVGRTRAAAMGSPVGRRRASLAVGGE